MTQAKLLRVGARDVGAPHPSSTQAPSPRPAARPAQKTGGSPPPPSASRPSRSECAFPGGRGGRGRGGCSQVSRSVTSPALPPRRSWVCGPAAGPAFGRRHWSGLAPAPWSPPGACGGRRGFPATRPEPIKQRPWSRSLFKPFLGESAAHRGSGTAALGGLMTSMLAPRSIQVLLKCHLLQEALPPYPVRTHRDLAPHRPLFLPDSSCGPRPHQTWPCAYRLTDRPSTSPLAGRLRVYRLLDLFTAVSRLPERCSASSGCVADRCLH